MKWLFNQWCTYFLNSSKSTFPSPFKSISAMASTSSCSAKLAAVTLSVSVFSSPRCLESALRGPGRKHGTPVSRWQQQLVSRIEVPDHAPELSGLDDAPAVLVQPANAAAVEHRNMYRKRTCSR